MAAKKSRSTRTRRSYARTRAKTRHKKPVKNVPAIPLLVEAGGLVLGLGDAVSGNVAEGAIIAAAGLVGGWALEKVGKTTIVGRAHAKVSRKHTVSII